MRFSEETVLRVAVLINLVLFALCVACGDEPVVKPKKKAVLPATTPAPATNIPMPVDVVMPALPPAQLARRASLDLLNRLPPQADVDALVADPTKLMTQLDAQLDSPETHRVIADMHPRMWRLKASVLPDLDRYVALADPTLGTALTSATKVELLREPALALRLVLDLGAPFASLFTTDYAILHTDVAALLGRTGTGEPWPGEPYVFAPADDGRPAGGVLTAAGTLAAYDLKSDATTLSRSARILHTFGCYRTEARESHYFYDLTAEELASDLSALAVTRKPCAGCHAQFHEAARAFVGFGTGATFAEWRAYAPPSGTTAGFFAGRTFSGLSGAGGLAKMIADDPRTHRCEIERLASELFQRRFSALDVGSVAAALAAFYDHGGTLKPALLELLRAQDFRYAAALPSAKGQLASGIRLLKRQQWISILRQLAPETAALEVPDELDPGVSEAVTDVDRVPTGLYFRHADRLARQAATAIVNIELAPGVAAATRRVLIALPDGVGNDATDEQVRTQIKRLWQTLTSTPLEDANPILNDFVEMWAKIAPEKTEADFKRAWRTILTAALTHPFFLTY